MQVHTVALVEKGPDGIRTRRSRRMLRLLWPPAEFTLGHRGSWKQPGQKGNTLDPANLTYHAKLLRGARWKYQILKA